MTGYSFSTPVWEGGQWVVPAVAEVRAARKANGPEDQPRNAPSKWDKVDWRAQEGQRNTGRKTAGIDGEVALTPEARAQVAVRVHQSTTSWNPRAVKRVYIPKASNRAKLRPLGIPVIMDRCHQQRVRHALEPEWEARFEPRSNGFRPGRSCQDAIAAIYNVCKGPMA